MFPSTSSTFGRVLAILLASVSALTPPGAGEIYTSTHKIVNMAASEGALLESLSTYLRGEYNYLKMLSQFLTERSDTFYRSTEKEFLSRVQHPNGAYLSIQFFSRQWARLVNERPGLRDLVSKSQASLPSEEDYQGALSALIRLQHVYELKAAQMYAGNYLGHEGPALHPSDTFLLGRRAYMDGLLLEAIEWLTLCRTLLEKEEGGRFPASRNIFGMEVTESFSLAQVLALLGRSYFYMSYVEKAREMYNLASSLEPHGGDVTQLKRELDGQVLQFQHKTAVYDTNMTALCSRPKHLPVLERRTYHVCRYKPAFKLSYLLYQEEILSVQPYVSLFYDVIHDAEIDVVKKFIKGKLFRGRIGQGNSSKTDSLRTSDLGWIHDHNLDTAAALSQRVKLVTGLEVDQRQPHGPSSAEAMQVVNYGLGGHYSAHTDPFNNAPAGDILLNRSGARIATFLMYLSDVELGGNTAFLKADISVAPKKGMALFWYNFAPDMKNIDMLTEHAGCPVVIGQKWIANKWIWTYGNTFLRPCGPHPNSTQLQVEKVLTCQSL